MRARLDVGIIIMLDFYDEIQTLPHLLTKITLS
jgi:hypothetical protein